MEISETKKIPDHQSITMEFHSLLGFLGILQESFKIFSKNGKLMAPIILLSVYYNSLFFFFNFWGIKPFAKILSYDLHHFANPKIPNLLEDITRLKMDVGGLLIMEWIQILCNFIFLLFLATAIIQASAITHAGKDITYKNLLSMANKSWKRPSVTAFHISVFSAGYLFLSWAIFLLPLYLIIESPAVSCSVSTLILITAGFLYAHISVVWSLAFVVSALEEMSGLEALGKAAKIVKGKRFHGFLLNLLFSILVLVVLQGLRLIQINQSSATIVIVGLLVVNCILLVYAIWLMAYTILYCQCKKIHGEDVEVLQGSSEYTKLPLVAEEIKEDAAVTSSKAAVLILLMFLFLLIIYLVNFML